MRRADAFLAKLHGGEVLLADGATGTVLQEEGLATGQAPERWILEQPGQIRGLHRSYIEAGSDSILTTTFGGTHYRLAGEGLGSRVSEVNRRAAELARDAAGSDVFVAGDMGPTGQLLAPLGKLSAADAAAAYAEQATALADGGVDLLLIETMSDLGEAQAAIEGARRVCDLPIVYTFSFDSHRRTMMGLSPDVVAQKIGPLVEAVGANCGKDPAEFVGFIQAMRAALPDAILWAKPNAGLPRFANEQMVYDATPEYMGQVAAEMSKAGAQVIGGCCGTRPAHVAAMAKALRPFPPDARQP